ncbi:hypothetical protein VNO78_16053 [Psophocarpus tetragonolobus]|uniref:Uncharacterized protein n=1 Tax=Psophocarpus tetragonolobus TaxID=3891 RepID=A0AAN9SH55_PSOTE
MIMMCSIAEGSVAHCLEGLAMRRTVVGATQCWIPMTHPSLTFLAVLDIFRPAMRVPVTPDLCSHFLAGQSLFLAIFQF